jgi:Virulence activator alpha C-term
MGDIALAVGIHLEKANNLLTAVRGFKSPGSKTGKFCVGVKSPLQNLITNYELFNSHPNQKHNKWIAQPCEPTPIKDDLLVKIFAGHIVPKQIILAELEHHQKAHLKKLSTYHNLEQLYFQNPQELPEAGKFQYLTLLNGISYETHCLAWCYQVMELLYPLNKSGRTTS